MKRSVLLLALLLAAFPVLSSVGDTATILAPSNDTAISGNETISLSWTGIANVTIEYSSGGPYQDLNSPAPQADGHSFVWQTGNGSFPDGTYDLRIVITNSSNASDNATLFLSNLSIDNTPPAVIALSASKHSARNGTDPVTISVNATDASGIDAITLTNGSSTLVMTAVSGSEYAVELDLSSMGCANDAICDLTVRANDTLGNANASLSTSQLPLYIDASAPRLLANSTNASTARTLESVNVSALWDEISLVESTAFSILFERWNGTAWTQDEGFSTWTNAMLTQNWTNLSYRVNRSQEGERLLFRATLTDSYNRSAATENLTLTVLNESPTIAALGNGSVIGTDDTISLRINDTGAGINATTISVTTQNTTITYSGNASLFSCTIFADDFREQYLCDVAASWLSGNATLDIDVSDLLGNANSTSVTYFVVTPPDIVNVSVSGAAAQGGVESVSAAIASDSREATFNWSVVSSGTVNQTMVAFDDGTSATRSSVPASVAHNVTAGRSYHTINATIDDSSLTDSVQLNLTADVPLDLSALAAQYEGGLLSNWSVANSSGTLFGTARVNDTLSLTYNISNASYTARFNYSGLDGMSLRWNTTGAFALTELAQSERTQLSDDLEGNVMVGLEHAGETAQFFDDRQYLLGVTMNLSNASFYYVARNGTNASYLLEACGATPASPLSEPCFTSSGSDTLLWLPRMEAQDRILVAEDDSSGPNVTIATASSISQSIVPLEFTAISPALESCTYALDKWNGTAGTAYRSGSVTGLSLNGIEWEAALNLTQIDDAQYNLTVSCVDAGGDAGNATLDLEVSDSTAPTIVGTSISDIGLHRARAGVSTNEPSTFTIHYGTTNTSLSLTEEGSAQAASSGTVQLEGLSSGTTYYARARACDGKDNCANGAIVSFTTTFPSSSSGGGGGAGDPSATPATISEAADARVFLDVEAGEEIEYFPRGLAVTSVLLRFAQASERSDLAMRQYVERPSGIAAAPGEAYRYLEFTHTGLESVERREITFFVPEEWLEGRDPAQVRLYRLENSWTAYAPERVDPVQGGYSFSLQLPGFSWFAIGLASAPPASAIDPTERQPVQEQPAQVEEPLLEEKGFVSALDDAPRRIPLWLIAVSGVLFAALAGAIGLQQYRQHQERALRHEQQLREERERYKKRTANDPARPLVEYVHRMRLKGVGDEEIRNRLLAVGWDEVIVDQEMG